MPDDVSVARPTDELSGHPWVRGYHYWELFFGATVLAVLVIVWFSEDSVPGRVLATIGVAVLAVLYLTVGRRLALTETTGTVAVLYRVALLAVFLPSVIAAGGTTFLLIAIVAHVFWIEPLRFTVPLVIVLNFVPVLADLADGTTGAHLWRTALVAVITATASTGIGVGIIHVMNESSARAELIARLRDSRAEVARLSRQAGAAVERERLAADIHDTVTQGLSSIVLLTQAARTATDAASRDEQLRLAEQTARSSLAESREIVAALTPGNLTSATMADAIRELAAEHGADFTLRGQARELSASAAVVVLRSAQEALRNVAKHASHATATVRLGYDGPAVSVTVTDTGPGFDVTAATDGFGLRGMRNRAASIGGHCTIESAPTGTTVTVEVPR